MTYPKDGPRDIIFKQETHFTLTTDDLDNESLPNWKLLEMQWILQKIMAISEAVGAPKVLSGDDDMALMACSFRTIAVLLLDLHLNGYHK